MTLAVLEMTGERPGFQPATPILKWVGGKRALLAQINELLPTPRLGSRFFEPFLGGGAVSFSRTFANQIVASDTNAELINLYSVVANTPQELIAELRAYRNEESFYYSIRDLDRGPDWAKTNSVQRAARILYLNKTCFNGLYRVNSSGKFNTPLGNYVSPNYKNETAIIQLHEFLNGRLQDGQPRIVLNNSSYLETSAQGREGDVFYFDPPYVPISPTASFTSYQSEGFNLEDQTKLRDEALRLASIGASVLLSNSDTEVVRELYGNKKNFKIHTVSISRGLAAKPSARKKITEVLISAR